MRLRGCRRESCTDRGAAEKYSKKPLRSSARYFTAINDTWQKSHLEKFKFYDFEKQQLMEFTLGAIPLGAF